MNEVAPEAARTRRGRRTLLVLAALFFGPILVALALNVAGLHPSGAKNKGEKLQPYADLRAVVPRLADGGEYRWNPEQRLWRIAVVAPQGCAAACTKLAADLEKVRRVLGSNADHVQILWIGDYPADAARPASLKRVAPDAALLEKLPRSADAAGAPVTYVIDPNGFAFLRYAPGFDPGDLRSDMAKLMTLM
jgi:hypothetical protein